MFLSCFGVSLLLGCLGLPSSRENDKTQSASPEESSVFSLIASEEQNEDMSRLPSNDYFSSEIKKVAISHRSRTGSTFLLVDGSENERTFDSGGLLGTGVEFDTKTFSEQKVVYKSNWTGGVEKSEPFITDAYVTYSFSPLVDIPIENVVIPENVRPREKAKYDFEESFKYEKSYSELSSIASTKADSYSFKIGSNIGSSITISKVLELSTNTSSGVEARFSNKFEEKIKKLSETKSTIEKKIKRTFTFDNSDSDEYTIFVPCLRQKFKAYCVEHYSYKYHVEEYGSGLFNWDRNWKYTFESEERNKVSFLFVPVDNFYFEISKYRLSSNGLNQNLRPFSYNTIFL